MKWVFIICLGLSVTVYVPIQVQAYYIVQSDAYWKVSNHFENGWMNPTFNDSLWPMTRAPTRGRCDFYPDPIFIALPMWSYSALERGETYYRKSFTVENTIQTARLRASFDDDGDVYVNGKLVFSERSGKTEKTVADIDVSQDLHIGLNTVALYAIDSFGGCQWAQMDLDVKYKPSVIVHVPIFKQTDSLWSADHYDNAVENGLDCGKTIADCGCATTSLAMLLVAHQVTQSPRHIPTTPQSLNEYMQENGQCTEQGCASKGYVFGAVRWTVVNSYSSESHHLFGSPKIQYVKYSPFSISALKSELEYGNPVILKDSERSHWMVGYGYQGDDVRINDPYFERRSLTSSNGENLAESMQLFEKVNSDFSLIEAFIKDNHGMMLTDKYGRRAGIDESGFVYREIPEVNVQYISAPHLKSNSPEITWITIQHPASGPYFVQGDGLVYTSTQNAYEKMYFVSDEKSIEIEYSQEEVSYEKRGIDVSMRNACLKV